ncbi:multidrug effflux MFS transporter [Thauera sp.]|jgi:DHA1 family bicyclomycin/chloramphenicol resistance-like MFS transporter|uniref:multidrug effflux MFS transporter n=1 Tax=Thauera sp. TaxID=1905334 RepID=UPI0026032191|nr:multidrug effflux MFS transporter [Thauera sp.]MCK6409655.1 multidrug effflux MFS transporter [Thauera sp.]
MTKEITHARLASLLAALSAIGPFAIDAYLPAFPAIRAELGARPLDVQQTLTVYMGALGLMVLWHGALADRFGRRRVLIALTAVFALASLVCALAPTIECLWLGRALQGVSGGAGIVVGRAVVRDLHEGPQAQRLMSRVMLIFALAPAVAPLLGAGLLAVAGWRAIFVFLALFGLALAWATWRFLPETLAEDARQPLHPLHLLRGYRAIFSNPAFLLLALAVALNFNGFFIYVLSAPVFILDHLGLGSGGFVWLFGPAVGGMMIGSMASERLAGRWSPPRTVGFGFVLMFVAVVLNTTVSGLLAPALPLSVLPIGLFSCGMAVAMPSMSLLGLELFPDRRGMASSCQSFLQIGLNAVSSAVAAPLLWSSTLSLATGMAMFAALGLSAWLAWCRFGGWR